MKITTQIRTPKEQEVAKKVSDFDQEVTKARQTGTMGNIYDYFARQALCPGEKLEMVALKSLSTGSREELFKQFGFDEKKVTFEAEQFLGKQAKKSGDESGKSGRLDKAPVITENPFVNDLDDLTIEGATNFFDQLSNQPEPKKEEPKARKPSESAQELATDYAAASQNPSLSI